MLDNARVATRLPAQDLERARRWYSEKLGLEPSDERPGGLLYRLASGEFALFQSTGESPGSFTQIAFEVDDIDAVVAGLRERGVEPAYEPMEVEGHYPSKNARGERAAWFRDSENNLLGIGEPVR
jgi:catechol 2,3-dioxygenase-like lactoylglutathione lyase family enzyme